MGRQTKEEIRKEVLEEDAKKDVSIYLSIPVGIVAFISSGGAVCAVIVMRAMVYFRSGVDAYWLSCVPFIFPAISGLFAAYKKQFGLLGVHLAVTMLAMLMGGFGFGLSVEPIFVKRHECVSVMRGVDCVKTTLSYLYLVSGFVAAGFAVLGFLITLCSLYSATKRIAERERQAEVQHLRDVEEHQKELRKMKQHEERKPRTLSMTSQQAASQGLTPTGVAPNGIPQTQVITETAKPASGNEGGEKVTTKL